MKYMLLKGFAVQLANEVNTYLNKGWELYGFPFGTGEQLIVQAMVYDTHAQSINVNVESPSVYNGYVN